MLSAVIGQCPLYMSACLLDVRPKADIRRCEKVVRKVPIATFRCLFDHLVGPPNQCVRDFEAERLGSLEVDA